MKIVNILDKNQLIHVNKLLTEIDFEDGEKSASGLAKKAKNNEEAKIDGSSFKEISSYFTNILQNNDWLNRRYLQKQFSQPIINKYLVGSSYGRHFDASHMRIQSLSSKKDFSFTLMLSKASDY